MDETEAEREQAQEEVMEAIQMMPEGCSRDEILAAVQHIAFCGETVRKFSGRKLLQSHSWARGHESVVSDGSVERPHHFVR